MILSFTGHTVGASDGQGTLGNARELKETGSQSAAAVLSQSGFYSVDHQGQNDPDAIEAGEALLFELSGLATAATFELVGPIHGATYNLYDSDGAFFDKGSLGDLVMQDGLVVIEHAQPFAFIAFLGGTTGPGQSGTGSAFSVRPVELDLAIAPDADSLDKTSVETFGWTLGGEEESLSTDESISSYRLGDGDSLDLRDLLSQWDGGSDTLDHFLQVTAAEDGDTYLHLSASGAFDAGELFLADQLILLEGISYHGSVLQQLIEDNQIEIE
ncbi:hypothetical protein Q427_04635 [Halomonas sp. BC04]|nr:hypothetical protein Q427_04635 [Halomonas sp. BC04]